MNTRRTRARGTDVENQSERTLRSHADKVGKETGFEIFKDTQAQGAAQTLKGHARKPLGDVSNKFEDVFGADKHGIKSYDAKPAKRHHAVTDDTHEHAPFQSLDSRIEQESLGILSEIEDVDQMSICEDIAMNSLMDVHEISMCSIDEMDAGNAQTAALYVKDIFEYYRTVENAVAVGQYMHLQPDVNEHMRKILIDWLVEVHLNFKLRPETIFLAVHILDRFLAQCQVSRSKLQLVGCGALLIASKYEDIYSPEIGDFTYITKNAYTMEQILEMESCILNTLEFRISLPTCFHFAQRFLKAAFAKCAWDVSQVEQDHSCLKVETLYFLLLGLLDYGTLAYSPSMVASAAVYLAFCRLDMPWTEAMERYTTYSLDDLNPCAVSIYAQYQKDREVARGEKKGDKQSSASRYYQKRKNVIVSQAEQLM